MRQGDALRRGKAGSRRRDDGGERTGGAVSPRSARAWIAGLPWIPLPFLGLGVFRAWLHLLAGTVARTPAALGAAPLPAFPSDPVIVATFLTFVLLARRLTPLRSRRWVWLAAGALLAVGSLTTYAVLVPGLSPLAVSVARVIADGVGIPLMFLLWFELFGSIGPTRTCLSYAGSFVVSAAISWFYQGFQPEWLPLATAVLPLVSLRCLQNCYRHERIVRLLGESEDEDEERGRRGGAVLPRGGGFWADGRAAGPVPGMRPDGAGWASFAFPWKPVLVIAAFSFAYGLLSSGSISGVTHPTLTFDSVLSALVFTGALLLAQERVGAGLIYPALAGLSALCLTLACVSGLPSWAAATLVDWGYMANQVFIMTVMAAICQRHGANPVWLFGIERAVNVSVVLAGGVTEGLATAAGVSVVPLLIVVVLAALLVVLGEGRFGSAWGVHLSASQADPQGAREARELDALARRCSEVAQAHGLSQREEEVLLLLARHRTARDIERELCVANGTAKAHIRHVYQKLDIHTREELFAMVGASELPGEGPDGIGDVRRG